MPEFSIDRLEPVNYGQKPLAASGETDADSGGGTTFVFGGEPQPDGEQEEKQEKKHKEPPPIAPPVSITLSSAACLSLDKKTSGGSKTIGGKYTPPPQVRPTVERLVQKVEIKDMRRSSKLNITI